MKIIIAGAGAVGSHLAKMLSKEQHDIVLIDTDREKLEFISDNLDLMAIYGSASSIETLKEANIKNSDLFIAVSQTEEVNITASILAKNLGAKKTITRINNKEYLLPSNVELFQSLGIDMVLCPEKLASLEIVNLLKQTGVKEIFEFSGGKLLLFVIRLENNAPFINLKLSDTTSLNSNFDYRAVAVTRNNRTIIPKGDDELMENDLVHVITNKKGIPDLLLYAGKKHVEISNVMILGGSRIGQKTAKDLQDHLNIKIIESNKHTCIQLADFLEKSLIIHGDGSDIDLLKEERIEKMDAFVAVTGNSETNILACLLAKQFGVKRTIAEVENIDYIDVSENIGIDTIVNKKLITASYIYRFTMQAEVASVKCLTGTDAEVLEFVVHKNAKITKKELRDINFPENAIIGGIVRGEQSYIAKGDTKIMENDKVVVFSLPDAIHKVEKFFN